MKSACSACLWYDLCPHEAPCEYYDNGTTDDADELFAELQRDRFMQEFPAAWRDYTHPGREGVMGWVNTRLLKNTSSSWTQLA